MHATGSADSRPVLPSFWMGTGNVLQFVSFAYVLGRTEIAWITKTEEWKCSHSRQRSLRVTLSLSGLADQVLAASNRISAFDKSNVMCWSPCNGSGRLSRRFWRATRMQIRRLLGHCRHCLVGDRYLETLSSHRVTMKQNWLSSS